LQQSADLDERDIEGVVRCLAAGVALYEQHPTCVHEPTSQLRNLFVFIRSARSLSKKLKREDEDLRELEERANRCGVRAALKAHQNEIGAPNDAVRRRPL
jgi:hypothetical protein